MIKVLLDGYFHFMVTPMLNYLLWFKNGLPKLTCRKKGQGHPRVMIYINFVELHCLMLHVKFQNHRPSGSGEDFLKVFAIYSHGGHLGHGTWTIYINFFFPLPKDAPHDVWL